MIKKRSVKLYLRNLQYLLNRKIATRKAKKQLKLYGVNLRVNHPCVFSGHVEVGHDCNFNGMRIIGGVKFL